MLHDRLHCQVVASLDIALLAPFAGVLLRLTIKNAVHRLLHHHLRAIVALHVIIIISVFHGGVLLMPIAAMLYILTYFRYALHLALVLAA